jgi:hypothetical protein
MAYTTKKWSISISPALELITFFYFFVPYIVFFLGYLNWYVSLAFIAIFAKVFRDENSRIRNPGMHRDCTIEFSPLALVFMALVIFVWAYFSGIGHFAYTNSGYIKHEAVFHDLVQLEWPVFYALPEDHSIGFDLDYYFAYYLVPAVAGNWVGYACILKLSFVWAI